MPRARATFLFGLVLFLPIVGNVPPRVHAQEGFANWRSFASGNEILALETDPVDDRVLWAGTEGGGLLRWDIERGSFEQWLFPQADGLLSNDVYDIAFDARGEAWLATGEGVTHAPDGRPWTAYTIVEGLPSPWVRAIAVDGEGTVWAGTELGIARLFAGASEFELVEDVAFDADPDEPLDGPGALPVIDLAVDALGSLYAVHGRNASDGAAISIYDPSRDAWQHVPAAGVASSQPGAPTDKIMALDFGPDGRLWLATWGKGVAVWDLDEAWENWDRGESCGKYVWSIDAREVQGTGSPKTEVWAGCGDNSSGGQGVARFDGDTWTSWTTAEDLPSDVVTAIAPAAGLLLLGTNGSGDRRLGGGLGAGIVPMSPDAAEPGGYKPLAAYRSDPTTPFSNDVTALTFENDGTLWVGTNGAGLLRRAPSPSYAWSRYTYESTDERLAGDTITDMVLRRDKSGTRELWVSAVGSVIESSRYLDGGISVLNLDTGNWDFTLRPNNIDSRDVGSLAVDDTGRVWIGFGYGNGMLGGNPHEGQGVAAYDPDRARYEKHIYIDGASDTLPGDTVGALAARGTDLWAATSYRNGVGQDQRRVGGGVAVFDGQRWTSWTGGERGFASFHGTGLDADKDPYITGDVRSVMVDSQGDAWAGSFDLSSGDLSSLWPFVDATVNHQIQHSTLDWESWSFEGSGWISSIAEDSTGKVWAGTTRGHWLGSVAMREHSPSDNRQPDSAIGGAQVWDGRQWIELTPLSSGIASNAITALAVDPTTGWMWVGTENSGLSVFTSGVASLPTPTPGGPTAPPSKSATPRPSLQPPTAVPGATSVPGGNVSDLPFVTVTPGGPEDEDDDRGGSGADDEPQPPSEVPEPGTWLMMLLGLGAIAAWLHWRERFVRV